MLLLLLPTNPKRHLSGLRQLGSQVKLLKSFVIQECLSILMQSWHRR